MDPGLNGINLFAFYLVVTRGYVQPKLLDIFSWSYNLGFALGFVPQEQ